MLRKGLFLTKEKEKMKGKNSLSEIIGQFSQPAREPFVARLFVQILPSWQQHALRRGLNSPSRAVIFH